MSLALHHRPILVAGDEAVRLRRLMLSSGQVCRATVLGLVIVALWILLSFKSHAAPSGPMIDGPIVRAAAPIAAAP